jgi:hypothetical protein
MDTLGYFQVRNLSHGKNNNKINKIKKITKKTLVPV